MADSKQIQQIVERAVAQVLDQQLPKLQAALVERVLAELPAQPAAPSADGQASSGNLARAVSSIHAGTTQKEILRALLDAGSSSASRVALFVVKAGAASGWQSRGFGNDETVKDFSLDMTAGPIAHAYQNRVVAPANIAEMDRRFVKQFGGPENEQILVLPLVLKEKVAALLYADGGSEGVLDAASLEVIGDGHQFVARGRLASQGCPKRYDGTRSEHGKRERASTSARCSGAECQFLL